MLKSKATLRDSIKNKVKAKASQDYKAFEDEVTKGYKFAEDEIESIVIQVLAENKMMNVDKPSSYIGNYYLPDKILDKKAFIRGMNEFASTINDNELVIKFQIDKYVKGVRVLIAFMRGNK